MLGNLLLALRHRLPDFPGRQRLLALCDRAGGPFVASTREGIRLQVFASSFMDALYFDPKSSSSSDSAILAAEIARLREGALFIDIGANIGYYSLLAARQIGPAGLVLSFEPSPREFSRLLRNIALNGSDNIVTFSLALGAHPGVLDLHVAPTHTGLNTLHVSDSTAHAFREAQRQRVPVMRFDDLVPPLLGERQVSLLKIDVEGAEMSVLLGMETSLRNGLFERIVLEVTAEFLEKFGHSKAGLYAFLEECGYEPRFRSEAWQYDEVFERR